MADMEEELPRNFNIMIAFDLPVSVDEQVYTCEENEQGVLQRQCNNKRGFAEMKTQERYDIVTNSRAKGNTVGRVVVIRLVKLMTV